MFSTYYPARLFVDSSFLLPPSTASFSSESIFSNSLVEAFAAFTTIIRLIIAMFKLVVIVLCVFVEIYGKRAEALDTRRANATSPDENFANIVSRAGLPTSEIEGSYRAVCSKPENNGRNLASDRYANVFEKCRVNGDHERRNCPEDTYFFEFVEMCIFLPCGVGFEKKISSAIDDGRENAKPCRPCKNSCNGDVFEGDVCRGRSTDKNDGGDGGESSSPSSPPPPSSSTTTPRGTTIATTPTTTTTTPNPLYECPMEDYPINIAHPCGCRKYQICQRGRKSIAFCRKGMIYDIARRMCNRESDVKCPNNPNCDNDLLLFDERATSYDPYDLTDWLKDHVGNDTRDGESSSSVEPLGLIDGTNITIRDIHINQGVSSGGAKGPFLNPSDWTFVSSQKTERNNSNSDDAVVVEPYGLIEGTNVNVRDIHINVLIPSMNKDEFEIVSPQRDDCADPESPRNFQFQRDYYDMYATCVNDRETKVVFCPDGTYFNRHVEFCTLVPNYQRLLPVKRGDFGESTANRCRYCTPESTRSSRGTAGRNV